MAFTTFQAGEIVRYPTTKPPESEVGFGEPTAQATTLQPTDSATVQIQSSGPDTAKVFEFSFGIPKGAKGDKGATG